MPTNSKKNILIVGGAGYIGSHMNVCVKRAGYIPLIIDNLSTGHRNAVLDTEFIEGDMHDTELLDRVFNSYPIAAVMHFASYIQVGESVIDPAKYYHNNVAGTLNLLMAMLKANVKHFIFSSTAAVYGEPQYTPIDEKHPIAPINPYGHSKAMVEQMLWDFAAGYDLKFIALRYFNAAGADPEGRLKECHDPETHLIPLILQVASGLREAVTVYGNDYKTPDGTCVRDYVHVNDLCDAHLLALERLWLGAPCGVYNLGTGQGYSVQEVLEAARDVTGCKIAIIDGKRREGDPAVLVADATKAVHELEWKPQYTDLKTIVKHAWR